MTPVIYNLFPRLVGPTSRWVEHAARARAMEFNWLYLNPWHAPGFSGSLYAPKEFRRLNPLFLPPGSDEGSLDPLRHFLEEAKGLGLPVMMDLVINHTSKDSTLVSEHPSWYHWNNGELVSPSVTDPDDSSKITVWGDLAEIDNESSPDRASLWEYWADLVTDSLDIGFSGFRCDAAYMVPVELWRFLIDRARERHTGAMFFAETLGAPLEDVLALKSAGFDFFFNSSKWWNFRDPWALEQHERFGAIAPSVSFPETHDTPRLAAETAGSEAIQRQRYAFALAFSGGVMMPLGYEYGFRRRTDVVRTMPSDWERKAFDLSDFVRRANRLKLSHAHLQTEGTLRAVQGLGSPVLVLERRVDGDPDPALIIVNTDASSGRELLLDQLPLDLSGLSLALVCRDDEPGLQNPGESIQLRPAEVAYLLPPSRSNRISA